MVAVGTTQHLLDLLETGRTADDGEEVDLLAHALQCASLLVDASPDDPELQVAGLVHDIGTLLEPGQPATHATTGARALESLLGPRIAELVGRHDDADPAYRRVLSEQSVATMSTQGGLLDRRERTEFEALPMFETLLTLRRADDAAKVAGRAVPGLDTWSPVIHSVAARR